MRMRLLLAATLATGLALAPAVFALEALAVEAAKSATAKTKKHKSAKSDKKAAAAKPQSGHPLGAPYTMQKDEMTR